MSEDINITWKVNSVKAYKNLAGYENYVYQTYWNCAANYSGVSGVYESSFAGATPLSTGIHPEYDFKPFSQLSQEDVLSWIWDTLPYGSKKDYYENKVTNELLFKMNYTTEEPSLPWNPPAPPSPASPATP